MLVTLDVLGVSLVSDESNIYRSPINPHDWFQNSTPDIRPHFTQIQIHEILNPNTRRKNYHKKKHIQNVLYMWKVMTVFLISHIQWALYYVGADWSVFFRCEASLAPTMVSPFIGSFVILSDFYSNSVSEPSQSIEIISWWPTWRWTW